MTKPNAFRMATDGITVPSVIPTGLQVFDKYLCPVGGIPRGMITEIYGPSSTWKSGFIYKLLATAQRLGEKPPALIDSEGAVNEWAVKAGVDFSNLYLPQRGQDWVTLEDVWHLIQQYIDAEVPLVCLDSLGAMTTSEQIRAFEENKDVRLGTLARATKAGLGGICSGGKGHVPLHMSKTAVVILNHIYDKLEDTSHKPVYDRYATPAGHELKFLAHLRLFFWTVRHDKGDTEAVRQLIRIWVTKTRFSPPLRHADIYIDFDNQAYEDSELIITLGLAAGIVVKEAGSYFSINGTKYNGKEATWQAIQNDPAVLDRIFTTEFEGCDVMAKVEAPEPEAFE